MSAPAPCTAAKIPLPGDRHDSRALAESGIAGRWACHLGPGGPGVIADLGYLGTAGITGTGKPRGGELSEVRRACNQAINSTRAAVERAIAHLVNWKVLDTGWRGRLHRLPRGTTHRHQAGDLPNLGITTF
jgi:hypothetical protein